MLFGWRWTTVRNKAELEHGPEPNHGSTRAFTKESTKITALPRPTVSLATTMTGK